MKNFTVFPLTQYFYTKGKQRWKEPFDPHEIYGTCGPEGRPWVDCYYCFIPICFSFDIVSFNLFQCKSITNS